MDTDKKKTILTGIGASEGIGVGVAALIEEPRISYEQKSRLSVSDEAERFEVAVRELIKKTDAMAEDMRKTAGEKEAEILTGHSLMLKDPDMIEEVHKIIGGGATSEAAAEQVFENFASMFEATGDELITQRAADLRDIKNGIIKTLQGAEDTDISSLPKGSVIVARELTPSMTSGIVKENIAGIITEAGGKTSHSAIIAKALEIPAILGVKGAMKIIPKGADVIADGICGRVIVDPAPEEKVDYLEQKAKFDRERKELEKLIGKPTVTRDGIKVELVCNIGKPEDCTAVLEKDGEGVGLFRTEFLYMDSREKPDEEKQFKAYKRVAVSLKGKPIIVRTLDVGGDKDIPYLGLEKEENPFLGFRAVRYCLAHEELFREQLRALLRASAFGNIKVMIPLVTCVEEVRAVKELICDLMSELDEKGIPYNKDIEVGIMAETPAASAIADLLAEEADFFSIGTNDLTGYTMAVDRGNEKVAYLYSPYEPAVLRNIKRIIDLGTEKGIPVGMCGEAAADPKLIPLWISFGLTEYSVNPGAVLATRKEIGKWTKAEADALAEKVMSCATEAEILKVLNESRK